MKIFLIILFSIVLLTALVLSLILAYDDLKEL